MVYDMVRTERKFEDIIKQPHYKSIINLTLNFQDRNDVLEQIHYRYALQKGFKFPKKYVERKKEIKKFFGNELENLYKDKLISKCIKPGNTLSNFLKKLSDDYKILQKKKIKGNAYGYFIKKNIMYRNLMIHMITQRLDLYKPLSINLNVMNPKDVKEKIFNDLKEGFPEKTHIDSFAFGFNDNWIDKCDKETKDMINECLMNIYLSIGTILNIKYMDTNESSLAFFVESKIK